MAGYLGGNKYKGVAPALDALLGQLNARAPKRSKLSDGALGNASHAATVSFHNPNPAGIVQARDYTHDPANGLDTKWLAKALTQSGDPRILEIISNRRYWTPKGGWVPYTGSNPHDKHLHLSVRSEPALYNSTTPWNLGDGTPTEDLETVMADVASLKFVTSPRDTNEWWVTDGMTKRRVIGGEPELLMQLGLAEPHRPDNGETVAVIPVDMLDRIPVAPSA